MFACLLPKIEPCAGPVYHELVAHAVKRVLFSGEASSDLVAQMHWQEEEDDLLSIVLFCPFREGVGVFFHSMLSRWLIPGKSGNEKGFFSALFTMPEWTGEARYLVAEIIVQLKGGDIEIARGSLPLLAEEICLGASSAYQACRIMEGKALSSEDKKNLIKDSVARLIRLRHFYFDIDLFEQMQHFFVSASPTFFSLRSVRHSVRIVTCFYLFRKFLEKKTESGARRSISLKLLSARLPGALGERVVLGLCMGISEIKSHELFDQGHVVRALARSVEGVRLVKDSFVSGLAVDPTIRLVYLEVEKVDQSVFSFDEIRSIRRLMPQHIGESIECLTRPLFMPRNEEEVMRWILTLSGQLKFIKDLPQVVIVFDRQGEDTLVFTVILVRVLRPQSSSLQELLARPDVVLDRVREVGRIRNRCPKEAAVFRLNLPCQPFLRSDLSVDLYKARRSILSVVESIFGEVRDYNGGMIARQSQVFLELKHSLGDLCQRNELVLENFFHALFPAEWKSTVSAHTLSVLFKLLMALSDSELDFISINEEDTHLIVAIKSEDPSRIQNRIEALQIPLSQLVKTCFNMRNQIYLGYIFFSQEKSSRSSFLEAVRLS